MKSWTDYYDQPVEKRTKLLNVISLEFSHTALEKYVESPAIVSWMTIFSYEIVQWVFFQVREIDWITNTWPEYWFDVQSQLQKNLKQEHMYYPKTRKYNQRIQ